MNAFLSLVVCVISTGHCTDIVVPNPVPFTACISQGQQLGMSWLEQEGIPTSHVRIETWSCRVGGPEKAT
jgi:hypothetical protein